MVSEEDDPIGPRASAYLAAVAFVTAAIALRWSLDDILGGQLVFTTLFGAVALAAWYGGIGPGLLAAVTGYLAADFLLIAPRGSIGVENLAQWIGVGFYVASCALTIAFGESMRRRRWQAERYLRESIRQRNALQVTLASIGDAVIATDEHAGVTFMNSVAEQLTGWTQRQAQGMPLDTVFAIVHERTRAPVENPALRALKENRAVLLANHTILLRRDGHETPIDDSAAPITDESGHVLGAILVFRDVSERRRQEIARSQLAAIVTSSHDAVIGHSLDGTVTSWNRAAETLYGYSEAEMLGQSKSRLLPEGRADELIQQLNHLREGTAVAAYETVRRRKDGSLVDVLITASPIANEEGEIVGAATIGRDISFRKSAEAALRAESRKKDEFLAILAHELRNPLAALSNGLHIVRQENTGEAARRFSLGVMQRQLNQLVRLVDDLLDVSRISRGKLQLRMEEMDLATAIDSAIETNGPLIEQRRHRIEKHLPAEPIRVYGDAVRLSQVFSNLINNAARYTEPGGRIAIELLREGTHASVRVSDSGIGLSPDQIDSIFDMFTQVEGTLTKEHGGLGIGLWLVRTLVHMHQGSIEVHSNGPGRGTTFTVRLPLAR